MLNELLERYWNAAYTEGKEWRDHDTEDGTAQQTLSAIHAEVRRLVTEEREACAKVCDDIAEQYGKDGGHVADHCATVIRMRSNEKVIGANND